MGKDNNCLNCTKMVSIISGIEEGPNSNNLALFELTFGLLLENSSSILTLR